MELRLKESSTAAAQRNGKYQKEHSMTAARSKLVHFMVFFTFSTSQNNILAISAGKQRPEPDIPCSYYTLDNVVSVLYYYNQGYS